MIGNPKQPPLHRTPMAYRPFTGQDLSCSKSIWTKTLAFRRTLFFILVVASMLMTAYALAILMNAGLSPLSWSIIAIFVFLFGRISFNFWTVIFGFIMTLRKKNDGLSLPKDMEPIIQETRTALIMPIYHEPMARVYSILRATYESLKATGQLERFDIYILSDSSRNDSILMEEKIWSQLCADVDGFERIFYRRRKSRIHKKAGNVSDFCRRWGSQYKYMLIFDGDSLMEGDLLVRLVNAMESRNDIGILQMVPMPMNQTALASRLRQFCTHVYGPLYFTGLRFWQLDESSYWGHNAIVRMYPFMKYCVVPRLPGKPPFGGEIMNHDFVEGALMRRAGWGVWLAYELEGSYEESPPSLSDELERDQRWCQGNLQHISLTFMKGISFGHRLVFSNGYLFYFASLLWFLLLCLVSTYFLSYFFHMSGHFSVKIFLMPWLAKYQILLIQFLIAMFSFIMVPKVLSVLMITISDQQQYFAGVMMLCASVLLETLMTVLLAPVRTIFHAWYLVKNMLSEKLVWETQLRHSKQASWGLFFREHGFFMTPPDTHPSKVLLRYQDLLNKPLG